MATYAETDGHPVKAAVEGAATAAGWTPPGWYVRLRTEALPVLATAARAEQAARAASVRSPCASCIDVAIGEVGAEALLAWRLGMPQLAPFVTAIAPPAFGRLVADARARLGSSPPPLIRRVIVLWWRQ